MKWLRTSQGILLSVGIFCFLLGVGLGTSGSNAVAGLASIGLLTAGAVTVTWGVILALRVRKTRTAEAEKAGLPPES